MNGTNFINRNAIKIKVAEILSATRINITGNDNTMSLTYLLGNSQLIELLNDSDRVLVGQVIYHLCSE